jgi:hypothetical protein
MSDDTTEPLTPAQERVRALLAPLGEQRAPSGDELTATVGRTARWQRPVRRVLVAVGTTAAAFGVGLGSLVRGWRSR